MDRHRQLEINCSICNRQVNLQTDPCTDENGHAIHEDCYAKRVIQGKSRGNSQHNDGERFPIHLHPTPARMEASGVSKSIVPTLLRTACGGLYEI